jgi:hypothetical protein
MGRVFRKRERVSEACARLGIFPASLTRKGSGERGCRIGEVCLERICTVGCLRHHTAYGRRHICGGAFVAQNRGAESCWRLWLWLRNPLRPNLSYFSQASGRHQNIRLETRRILQDVSRAASRDMPHFLPP